MRVWITGITGMIGSALVDRFEQQGDAVTGIARGRTKSRLLDTRPHLVQKCDVLDRPSLENAIASARPDLVIHLAAQAYNGLSWDQPQRTHTTNFDGTRNLLDAVRQHAPQAAVMIACSSAEYGLTARSGADASPIHEDEPLRPVSPYGVSKVAAECLAVQYAANFNLRIFLPRLFIHVGTGHPPATAIQNFARQLASISLGQSPPRMQVGNLESSRDFVDVRDGVDGMLRLIESGPANTPVNICTGRAWSIRQTLDKLIACAGIDVDIEHDAKLDRPTDESVLLGDNTRLRELGWSQRYSFDQTLEAVFDDWTARLGSESKT